MPLGYLHIQYAQYGDLQELKEFSLALDSCELDVLRRVVAIEVFDGEHKKAETCSIAEAKKLLASVGIHKVTWKSR